MPWSVSWELDRPAVHVLHVDLDLAAGSPIIQEQQIPAGQQKLETEVE